jgi:hypothetical protein
MVTGMVLEVVGLVCKDDKDRALSVMDGALPKSCSQRPPELQLRRRQLPRWSKPVLPTAQEVSLSLVQEVAEVEVCTQWCLSQPRSAEFRDPEVLGDGGSLGS